MPIPLAMNTKDGVFGEVNFQKTGPGSKAARDQHKQVRLIFVGLWVLVLAAVALTLTFWVSWEVFAFLGLNLLGIPSERKFLRNFGTTPTPTDLRPRNCPTHARVREAGGGERGGLLGRPGCGARYRVGAVKTATAILAIGMLLLAGCGSSGSSTDTSGTTTLPAEASAHESCDEFNKRFQHVENKNGNGAAITVHCVEEDAPSDKELRECLKDWVEQGGKANVPKSPACATDSGKIAVESEAP
jgi:hypothetical protein